MIGNILSGIWIDRIGSKRILYLGMLLVGIVLIFYTTVSNPYQLLVVRFFHGIAGGFIVPAAFTYLGTRGKRKAKGKTMAFSGAGVGVAAIAGPALGAIVSGRYGYDTLFYLVSSLMIVFGMLAAFCLKNSPTPKPVDGMKKSMTFPNIKPLVQAYLSIFLLLYTLGLLTYLLPLKVEALHGQSEITGLLMSVFGLVAIVLFILPTNKLFDQWEKTVFMKSGLIIISIALIVLSISFTIWQMFLAMGLYGIGFALIFPSTSATVIECSKENEKGRAFGLFYACFSLGVMFGSFIAGLLPLIPTFQFFIGALFVLITVFIHSALSRFRI
ncbi:MFS transporter [Alkalihalobacterium alkalinitrilicum]|uniref:MFS transporter n=1 Tax=Alkalihalobacterium alkalinitrilicum TaxID=427920 RepID=UPI001EE3B79A|nr:MFS transporter [Alkalihalobacterium alkalinitrilicum]